MLARRLLSTALGLFTAFVGVLALSCVPAQAAQFTHNVVGSFGPGGPGVGTFSSLEGVAVDQSDGDVYVLDAGASSVYKFDATGHPVNFSGLGTNIIEHTGGAGAGEDELAVDSSGGPDNGDIYVANNREVRIYSAAGEFLGELTGGEACGVAVDSAGNVYVGYFSETVRKYTPASNPVSDANEAGSMGGLNRICNVAVDGESNIYAATYDGGVNRYEALQFGSLSASGTQLDSLGRTIAVDPSNNDVYVDEVGDLVQFSPTGQQLGVSGEGTLEGSLGVAVDGRSGQETLYADSNGVVDIFGPEVPLPEPTVLPASELSKTTAKLNGTVNPGGIAVTACTLEYRSAEEGTFGHSAACSPAPGSGTSAETVSLEISGLTAGTTYIYRVVATNHNGIADSAQESFTTPPAVDALSTGTAEDVTQNGAKFTGSLSPDGTDAHYYFEYGAEAGVYGSVSPALPGTDAGSASKTVSAATVISGLTVGTLYHYRLVAVNSFGTTYGQDAELSTLPAVDALSTGAAEDVTQNGAKLTGSLSPDGTDAHYYFEYGTEAGVYGSVSPALPGTDAGSASKAVAASTGLGALTANTTYHYRLVGVNAFGTTLGEDQSFTTLGPPVIGSVANEDIGHSAATLTAQINPGGLETHYHFEYGPTSSYGTSVPIPDGAIVAGFAEQGVSVNITGLAVGTTYHFRVVAINADSPTPVDSPDQELTTVPAVQIDNASVVNVTATSAKLTAKINPLGTDTSAYFQYGAVNCTENPSSCTDLPIAPGANIGAAEADQTLSENLEGLTPGATYHYRVVATNTLGSIPSPDRTFTAQGLGGPLTLPDGRSWEMVTPLEKKNALILGIDGFPTGTEGGLLQSSLSGNGIVYTSNEAFGDAKAAPLSAQYLATRSSGGWSSTSTGPEIDRPVVTEPYALIGGGGPYKMFSDELTSGLLINGKKNGQPGPVEVAPLTKDAPEGYPNFYLQKFPSGELEAVLKTTPSEPASEFRLEFVAASPDMSHIVFSSPAALTENATSETGYFAQRNLYEWSDGKFELINVLPGEDIGALGAEIAGEENGFHTVSDDGSKVFFVYGENLYVHIAGVGTIEVDESKEGMESGQGVFQTASADGTRVFFTDRRRLTKNSGAAPGSGAYDLYEYDLESNEVTDLTPAGESGDAHMAGVLGASADGSYVYFVANGRVAPGGSLGECYEGTSGNSPQTCGLYVWHRGTPSTTKFIATLSEDDNSGGGRGTAADWSSARDANSRTSRVSEDGLNLAFMSDGDLTGYDSTNAETGQPEEEVYDYNAHTGVLSCASCDPSGGRPRGASNIPGGTTYEDAQGNYQSRALSSEDGHARLFFNSDDALVPQDTNSKPDVYEWEEDGRGSCRSTPGCTSLISSGTSDTESTFADASANGSNVFFLTTSQLVPQDTDNLVDLYDAREGGGFGGGPVPPICTGTGCQGVASAPPIFATPSSVTFNGVGNFEPPSPATGKPKPKATKCKSGFVKRNGRCVRAKKQPKKKSKKAKKTKKTAKGRK